MNETDPERQAMESKVINQQSRKSKVFKLVTAVSVVAFVISIAVASAFLVHQKREHRDAMQKRDEKENSLQEQLKQVEEERAEERTKHGNQKRSLDQDVFRLQQEKDELERKLDEKVRERKESILHLIKVHEEEMGQVQAGITAKDRLIDNQRKKLEEFKRKLVDSEKRNEDIGIQHRSELAKANRQKRAVEEKLQKAEGTIATQKDENDKLAKESAQQNGRIQKLTKEVAEQTAALKELASEKLISEQAIEDAKEKHPSVFFIYGHQTRDIVNSEETIAKQVDDVMEVKGSKLQSQHRGLEWLNYVARGTRLQRGGLELLSSAIRHEEEGGGRKTKCKGGE